MNAARDINIWNVSINNCRVEKCELNFTAPYRNMSNWGKKNYSKKLKIIKHKKSLVWTKKGPIKTTSFFRVVNYKFKNIMIGTFGSCWLRWFLSLTFSKNLSKLFLRFSKSSSLCGEQRWQHKRKCSVVLTSLPHAHIVVIVSPKPCLNFCSFRWLNWSLRRIRTLTPSGL